MTKIEQKNRKPAEKKQMKKRHSFFSVVVQVFNGVMNEGFVHAGNFAYMALLTLFPFMILTIIIASGIGRGADGFAAVHSFLSALPPNVSSQLSGPIFQVLAMRSGSLIWWSALVSLWSVSSFISSIRELLYRTYRLEPPTAFIKYRLGAMAINIMAVFLLLFILSIQVMLAALQHIFSEQFSWLLQYISAAFPHISLSDNQNLMDKLALIGITSDRMRTFLDHITAFSILSRIISGGLLFGALYILFYTVTPPQYREAHYFKWPGALLTAFWWQMVSMILPIALNNMLDYNRSYGGLAGSVIVLIYFWIIGLGLVVGVHLNATLAFDRSTPVTPKNDA
ncbi:MAG: YihY/virulence factor BrkB family protein [Zymomonas mobilis subsp. pomaceae]|uniref:Ribonuclease BN n=2 Tax=Zymomonas mobilis TaxID=542 RepID=F8EV97_ZYMMT|nr:YihY/virulence factor BrkB family protein [Zymomonas mobilis]AEI38315.1 ribonuclease BN [Zymomonas mobilis subsp. pomaceae ATCC 29192]MDX5948004.1 YihY/virulence factor BrkB family protein [Zymomonas mobilis subsp. pomaceae]